MQKLECAHSSINCAQINIFFSKILFFHKLDFCVQNLVLWGHKSAFFVQKWAFSEHKYVFLGHKLILCAHKLLIFSGFLFYMTCWWRSRLDSRACWVEPHPLLIHPRGCRGPADLMWSITSHNVSTLTLWTYEDKGACLPLCCSYFEGICRNWVSQTGILFLSFHY